MSSNNFSDSFANGLPAGVSNVARDASGRLLGWMENGFLVTVVRDASTSKPVQVVAQRGGYAGRRLVMGINWSGSVLSGTTGDVIPTVLRGELLGEGQSSVSGALLPVRTTKVRVATFGDSTANFGSMGNTTAAFDQEYMTFSAGAAGTVSVSNSGNKWQLSAIYPMAYPVANGGISGENTTQMLARDNAAASATRNATQDVLGKTPDVVLFRGASINDILALNLSANATAGQLSAIVDRHKNLAYKLSSGAGLVIDEGCAGFNAAGGVVPGNIAFVQDCVARLNQALADFYASGSAPANIYWLTPVGLTCSATGAFLPGYSLASDGTHLSVPAQVALAAAEKAVIDIRFGRSARATFPGVNLLGTLAYLPVAGAIPTGNGFSTAGTLTLGAGVIELDPVTGEVCIAKTVTAAGAGAQLNWQMPLNIYAAAPAPAINVTSGMKLGLEFDWSVETVDGSAIGGDFNANIRLDLRNSGTGRLVLDDGIFTGEAGTFSYPSRVSGHYALQVLINDVTANLIAATTWRADWRLPALAAGYIVRVKNQRVVQIA